MKRIALLGMPNTGKSTLFNRMTGGVARVGNSPGITVELLSGKILLGDDMVEIIDLPGIYDLHGFSDDEQVVRHFLHDNVPDLALVIVNTTQIERQMSLLLQLKQLDLNIVVMLNMADEAKKFGITVDVAKMSVLLEMPIFLLSAKYGSGYPEALQAITKALRYPTPGMAEHLRSQLEQDEHLESEMARVLKHTVQVPARLSEQPHRKTGQRDTASVAGTADLLRRNVSAVPGHLHFRPATANRHRPVIHLAARDCAGTAAGRPAASGAGPAAGWHI